MPMARLSREERARRAAIEGIKYLRQHRFAFNANCYKKKLATGASFERANREYDRLTDAIEYFEGRKDGLG